MGRAKEEADGIESCVCIEWEPSGGRGAGWVGAHRDHIFAYTVYLFAKVPAGLDGTAVVTEKGARVRSAQSDCWRYLRHRVVRGGESSKGVGVHGEKCRKDVEERCGAECVGAWKVEGHGRELHARVLVGVGAGGGGGGSTWWWCRSGSPCSRRRPRSLGASLSHTRIKTQLCRTRPKCRRRTWSSGHCTSSSRRPVVCACGALTHMQCTTAVACGTVCRRASRVARDTHLSIYLCTSLSVSIMWTRTTTPMISWTTPARRRSTPACVCAVCVEESRHVCEHTGCVWGRGSHDRWQQAWLVTC